MDYKKALNLAASLCSKKEYCCDDIRKKLLAWEITPKDCNRILDFLQKTGLSMKPGLPPSMPGINSALTAGVCKKSV